MDDNVQTWHYGLVARHWAERNITVPEIAYFQIKIEQYGQPALDAGLGTIGRSWSIAFLASVSALSRTSRHCSVFMNIWSRAVCGCSNLMFPMMMQKYATGKGRFQH